jgi:hypothetical protein
MIGAKITISGVSLENANVKKTFERHLSIAMAKSVNLLTTEAAQIAPVGVSGTYRAGITGIVRSPYKAVIGVGGPGSAYSPFVELGRRPGKMPPPAPLILWTKRVIRPPSSELLSVSWRVRLKIARKGTKGAFVFMRTFKNYTRRVYQIFVEELNRFAKELSQ